MKYKVASSWDSKEYYQKYRPQSLLERDRDPVLEAQLMTSAVNSTVNNISTDQEPVSSDDAGNHSY